MIKNYKISVCLPCRNEGSHLKEVLDRVPAYIDEILVISNKSTDDTVEVAKQIGGKVKVIEDNRSLRGIGYGYAHMTGINEAKGDIIIGADGDATYPLKDIKKIVLYLLKNGYDFISCNRYPLKENTKVPLKLRLGVMLLNLETLLLYRIRIKDILSGMWVFKSNIKSDLNLTMGDWNLSPQIKINAATNKSIRFTEYSIAQHQRLGSTKQNYFSTGVNHALWIMKSAFVKTKYNWSKILMYLALLIGVIIKLNLSAGQHLSIIGYASEDDRLFINLANNILAGKWLGPYTSLTLVKGPFYPLYLALIHIIKIRLLLSEQILYIFSCIVFLICIFPLINFSQKIIKRLDIRYLLITALGLLLVFNPISTDAQPATRVLRNGIYPALTLLTISLFIGLLAYKGSKIWKHILIGLCAGIALSCFWLTREEGVWLLPFTIGLTLYSGTILLLNKSTYWKWRILIIVLPFLILFLSNYTISEINYHYYKVRTSVEAKQLRLPMLQALFT